MNYFPISLFFSASSLYLLKDRLIKYWLFLKLLSVVTITVFGCYLNLNISDSFYNLLYDTINENKCLAIKFSQWIISRLNITYECKKNKPLWLVKFNKFFEDCPSHEFKYTQDAYFKLTNTNILDDYSIDFSSISSGSIGQVYKATHNKTQEIHAIKVKHPYLEDYMYLPRLFIRSLISFLKIVTFQKIYIPLDIEMFFLALENQLDFNLESENIKKMYANFEDNRLIIIPKVIKHNYDIIIMTYEEGTYFEKYNDISEFNKFKVALTYILFYHQCCYLDNFNHGDLHQGNWKIRLDDNQKDFCLIIYDLGVCYSFENSDYIKKFIESWENYDMKNMSEASLSIIEQNNDVSKHPNFKEELFNIFKDNEFKPFNLNKVLSLIYNCTKKYKLTFDYSTLNILISAGLCEQMLTKYKLMNTGIYKEDDLRVKSKDDTYKSQTLEYINFCQTRKVFPRMEQYYRDLLKEKNINLNSLFNNVELKLNKASQTFKFESTSKQLEI